MSAKCSQSFYDALGGKHRSKELFVVVVRVVHDPDGTWEVVSKNYELVCGTRAQEGQVSVDDLALLMQDERDTVTVHSYKFKTPIPFDPQNFRGRQARKNFDSALASIALGDAYTAWLKACAKNLPAAPDESIEYSRDVGYAFLESTPGDGMAYAVAGTPGVLAAGPDAFLHYYWNNSGMVDAAARVLVERLTPKLSPGEARLLVEYLDNVSPEVYDELCLKALTRLGVWDTTLAVEAPPLEHEEPYDHDESDPLHDSPDFDPPSAFMDNLRARALLLELELGVPGLAQKLGCAADPESARLTIYDMASGAAKHRAEYTAAQAAAERRVEAVVARLVARHKLVQHCVEVTLHTEPIAGPGIGAPIIGGDTPLAHVALVGMTADGRVFSYAASDRLDPDGNVTLLAATDTEDSFWHPSVADAIRGTHGEVLGYRQRLDAESARLEQARGTILERAAEQAHDDFIASGGVREGEREARARLLARIAALPEYPPPFEAPV